jgi:hypothetical protein
MDEGDVDFWFESEADGVDSTTELDALDGYLEDVLADILWRREDLCAWFRYEGRP